MSVCRRGVSWVDGAVATHSVCLHMFLPVIPISVAMTADAEHVGERRPHPPPLMKLECPTETCAHCCFLMVCRPQKCTVTGVTVLGETEHMHKTAAVRKHMHWYVAIKQSLPFGRHMSQIVLNHSLNIHCLKSDHTRKRHSQCKQCVKG